MKVSQINNAQSNSASAFKAKVSESFIEAAKNYYTRTQNPNGLIAFNLSVEKFKHFGGDNISIVYEALKNSDGIKSFCLFAQKDNSNGANKVLLAQKHHLLCKLFEKFMCINEAEFNKKTKVLK